jgi:hypothetical protein
MKFSYFPNQTALDSGSAMRAFLESCKKNGHEIIENSYDADVAIIWSVLWHARMMRNELVWNHYRSKNKPVVVLEVGALDRGRLWKVGVNGINGSGYFGPKGMDSSRRKMLDINIKSWKQSTDILICLQHSKSDQWKGMPAIEHWLDNIIGKLRKKSDKKIVVRSHPRHQIKLNHNYKDLIFDYPKSLNSVDDSINFKNALNSVWAVINWNSNPGVIAALNGIPVFTGPTNLAAPVANLDFDMIENPSMPDREQWANDLAYTEWTVDEIAKGEPLERIYSALTSVSQ